MPPRRYTGSERSVPKIVILMSLVFIIISLTSAVLTSYPQHLYLDDKTTIGSVAFTGNNSVIIKGNQIAYGVGDYIALDNSRDTIRITGNQVQLGTEVYSEAIRTLSASLSNNILFTQSIGTFSVNQVAQIGIDGDIINIIPISSDVLNIQTAGSNYNIQFVQETTYITTENGSMLKISKEDDIVSIFIVGIKNYQNIWLKVL